MALICISVMISDVEQFYVLFVYLYLVYLFKSFALFSLFFGHVVGTWDLSFPTGDRTRACCSGSTESYHWTPGKSLLTHFLN